jgi:hypothetical protein
MYGTVSLSSTVPALGQDLLVEFYGFNVDPDFSNCIDGFILVEVEKIKESKKQRYIQ